MIPVDILHFNELKKEVQASYLTRHTPSNDDISKWKGIDIIYFQEDLRKIAKGNISEKSFYTYFKSGSSEKLPRIDMLNLLSIYAGYASWYEFKKKHLFAGETLPETEEPSIKSSEALKSEEPLNESFSKSSINEENFEQESILQNNYIDNQTVNVLNSEIESSSDERNISFVKRRKDALLIAISIIFAFIAGILGFKDEIFSKKFTYSFVDADRNSRINAELQVKILKNGESPIVYIAKPNEPFIYTTKSKSLKMLVSSPYYKTQEITRNLETAPEKETIELVPNDYAIMLFYYSKSIRDLKRKRESLNYLISDNALIYQIYDNEKYGVETMDKQRYIGLVTLPTTSLENLQVIETRNDARGKINMIKFRIGNDQANK